MEYMSEEKTGLEVAVIGLAGRFPGAKDIRQFWENLKNGVESISFLTEQELQEAGVDERLIRESSFIKTRGGVLEKKAAFDASFFGYTPADAGLMDPQLRLFHQLAWHALEDAGYAPGSQAFSQQSVGLYAGASNNFFWEAYTQLPGKNPSPGGAEVRLLTDRDFLCTHISYKLDLKGPALVVRSACSTSLVAVHLACQGILNGECRMALSGGVSLFSHKNDGYIYQEGMLLSDDGHCRAFDARAKGTAQGEGAGIVVLKALEDALQDGDTIYAIIKGTAVNNDGKQKIGYTAPGVFGQAAVVREALQVAEVSIESIGYIETHGTGTQQGDPVEIEALKMAFNTHKKRYCAIGSVKTNIGHLDAAAGAAGLIKSILVLKNKILPPSLHFDTPNPQIDFDNSPFYVNTTLKEWKRDSFPLRAGVSAFGLGGTNAHVILEEAPVEIRDKEGTRGLAPLFNEENSKKYQLILLSAKTESALEKMTGNLAEHFKKNPGIHLADAAYTLQVGRQAFQCRRMTICREPDEAADSLYSPHSETLSTFFIKEPGRKKNVVFMFPGQGSQYINMGLDLYKTEPVFREEMDHCFETLNNFMDAGIKKILYPDEATKTPRHQENISDSDSEGTRGLAPLPIESAACDLHLSPGINQTEITQPILFSFEYALARLLMEWGFRPDVMIGHSIGEYTAACLSGVFSLADALKMVVLRGKIMDAVPPGAMLGVPLPVESVVPLLKSYPDLSLAAVNSSALCVVSGPRTMVDAFALKLEIEGCNCRKLHTSHAFHSPMMDPVLARFQDAAAKIPVNKVDIPYISNRSGKMVTDAEVADPGYWAAHLRETVQFSRGLETLFSMPDTLLLEVGPGKTLSTFALRHQSKTNQHQVVNLVRHPDEEYPDHKYLLERIGRLWLYGIEPDWKKFSENEKTTCIPLPLYPFEEKEFPVGGNFFDIPISAFDTDLGKENRFYLPSWKRSVPSTRGIKKEPDSRDNTPLFLVFQLGTGIGAQLTRQLKQCGPVISVTPGPKFKKTSSDDFSVNPRQSTDYETLFKEINQSPTHSNNTRIFHLWGLTAGDHTRLDRDIFDDAQYFGFYSLLDIMNAVDKIGFSGLSEISVVTANMQEVSQEDRYCPEKAAVLGPLKVIPQEYPGIRCRSIDIVLPEPGSTWEKICMEQLLEELPKDIVEPVIAFRDHYRWIETFETLSPGKTDEGKSRLKQGGIYLITGGLGHAGVTLAQYLLGELKAKLVLTGRSLLPPNKKSKASPYMNQDMVNQRLPLLKKLGKLGEDYLVFTADVADEKRMQEVVSEAEKHLGPINGVIHAAGMVKGPSLRLMREISKTDCQEQFQAKVYGTIVLEKLFRDKSLDFFLLMSSVSSVLGGLEFAAYSSANIFMDAFTLMHNHMYPETPWLSIDWDQLEPEETIKSIQAFLALYPAITGRVALSTGISLQERIKKWIGLEDTVKKSHTSSFSRPELLTPYVAPSGSLETELTVIFQQLLGYGKIGVLDDFLELGGDSLKAITTIAAIQRQLNVHIPLPDFFKKPTVRAIADYIRSTGIAEHVSIPPAETKEYYPLSSAQKRLYILQQIEKDNVVYNQTMMWILEGHPDQNKMKETLQKLVNRHESLKTSIEMIHNTPVQKIHDASLVNITLEIDDYTGKGDDINPVSSPSGWETLRDTFVRPFDLSRPPFLRVKLVKIGPKKYVLLVDIHHIITDLFSANIFREEFIALYKGNDLSGLALQYKDFAEWQQGFLSSGALKKQADYWLKEFSGDIPMLDLPTDYLRPREQSFEGNRVLFDITAEELKGIRGLARQNEATLFMVMLSIYTILLSRLSAQEDILVGTPTAGRRYAELEPIMGMFVNTLVLRNTCSGEISFREFLAKVRMRTLSAFENQDFQFEDLVEQVVVHRDTGRNPLFDVMFSLENRKVTDHQPVHDIPDLVVAPYESQAGGVSKFDMTLNLFEYEDRLVAAIEYCMRLFKQKTIEAFATYFKRILTSILQDSSGKMKQIQLVSTEEKEWLVVRLNATDIAYPDHCSLPDLFETEVEKSPDRVAVILEDQHMTYQLLDETASGVAAELTRNGIPPGSIVAVMVDRSLEMMMGILGILKAGTAYLPLEPDLPLDRIQYMLADSNARALVTQPHYLDRIKHPVPLSLDAGRDVGGYRAISGQRHGKGTDPAYVIYTSGTTGKPKGTLIPHRSAIRVVKNTNYIDITNNDRLLQLSNYAFDVSVFDIFGAFLNGAVSIMLHSQDIFSSGRLSSLIVREKITIFFITTTLFNTMVDVDIHCLKYIKKVLFGGERISGEHAAKALEYMGKGKIIHVYGPTESTVFSTYYFIDEIEKNAETIPIGKPLANTEVYILDQYLNLLPPGVPGELWISGHGLSKGYLNNPQMTRQRFIPNPFREGEKIYQTGDRVRWSAQGDILFLGRIDHQVKIRGFRIEPGEIEDLLLKKEDIREVLVNTEGEGRDDKHLTAYFISDTELQVPELREYLAEHLPLYMIPAYFIQVEQMPLNPNGKIDRKALAALGSKIDNGIQYVPPQTHMEKIVSRAWQEVLGKENISIHQNFFEVGGTSLKIIQLTAYLEKELKRTIPVATFFRYPTIHSFAGYLTQNQYESDQGGIITDEKIENALEKMENAMQMFMEGDDSDE
jgi:iturin family lipopeptide synthetase A